MQEWESYWAKKESRVIYDMIAECYRRFIIRPSLNYFIKKHFNKNEKVLHAGCGSGQVDRDIRSYINITALDISSNALQIYKHENGSSSDTVLGDIFSTPFDDAYFDGIYNLGVMEHFSHDEIKNILVECRRIIKPRGKIILFWPPTYGLSVLFFKILKKFLFLLTRKQYEFHPAEISQLQSKKHALKLLEKTGFELKSYHFGLRDLFTYVVVVAQAV